jgi:hypothetical protein
MNATVFLPGSSGARPARSASREPAHLLQLQHVPPGERPQERSQRGRRPDPAEQHGHRAVAQQVHVIDTVRPGDHPGHQARNLQVRVHPARAVNPDMLCDQAIQARPPGQGHHRDQARLRHEIRVIKRRVDLRQAMQQSHLRGVLSAQNMEASATPIVPAQRTPFSLTRPNETLFTRWIEAKCAFRETVRALTNERLLDAAAEAAG